MLTFFNNRFSFNSRWPFLSTGLILIIFGLLIAAFPRLLLVLVSSFFILLGLFLLFIGWGMREAARHSRSIDAEFYE